MVVILHVSIDLTNLKLKQTIMELDTNSCFSGLNPALCKPSKYSENLLNKTPMRLEKLYTLRWVFD